MAMRAQYSGVSYTGGHPDFDEPVEKKGILVADDKGLHLRVFREKLLIEWPTLTGLAVEGPEAAQKRVTVTRLVTIGIFAFGAKKNESESYLHTEGEGWACGFVIPKTSAGELRVKLGPWITRHRLTGGN